MHRNQQVQLCQHYSTFADCTYLNSYWSAYRSPSALNSERDRFLGDRGDVLLLSIYAQYLFATKQPTSLGQGPFSETIISRCRSLLLLLLSWRRSRLNSAIYCWAQVCTINQLPCGSSYHTDFFFLASTCLRSQLWGSRWRWSKRRWQQIEEIGLSGR